jgi:hypothetical protein
VGTATFWDPRATGRIVNELRQFVKSQGLGDVNALVGTLKL